MASCAECKVFVCRTGKLDLAPENCPMREGDVSNTRDKLEDPFLRKFAKQSALVEATGYLRWTRVEEIMEFSWRMGYKKLGIAFCSGLIEEGKILTQVLKANGFEVASVICKNGSIPKEEVGISDEQKVRPGNYEAICNPIGQAMVLNTDKTDFNILVGLCVGHDSLFIMHSEAPVTCLVAKDRVLSHNPAAALYCHQSYRKKSLYEAHKPS